MPTVASVERPRTRYADTGEVNIAYCRGGAGPIDVVVMPGFATHLELMWEPPFSGRLFDRFSRFARVTQVEKRGVGLSDRISAPATLEQRMDDLRVVMDAEGIERAAIVGISDGASMSALFAATHPERVSSLVLWAGGAGPPAAEEVRSALLPWVQEAWGSGEVLSVLLRVGSSAGIQRLAKLERYSMSPRMARALLDMDFTNDIRGALPVISAPTLVVHRRGDPSFDGSGPLRSPSSFRVPVGSSCPATGTSASSMTRRPRHSTSSRSSSPGCDLHRGSTSITCSRR
jgi:pimeloyl-ACP methyl ester carboxylesterase